jgi:hypothetical protein
MATNPIQPGDPVTADIINSLVLDIAELNKTKAGSFSLNLAATGGDQNKNAVSQKIYSTIKTFEANASKKPQIKWDLTPMKFTNPPRVWCQLVSKGSYEGGEFKFMIQVLSVSTTQAIFEVRGTGFKTAKFDLYVFAVEA